jgi:F-type H+-transporting ATPase subunit epsilon
MFSLTLVTPQKKIVEGAPLKEVFVPAFRGELEILPGHAPLITTLSEGVLKYKLEGATELKAVAVSWGYCEVTAEGQVNILAETAEAPEEIDLPRAEEARREALDKLSRVSYDEFEKTQRKFMRSEARIKTAKQDFH